MLPRSRVREALALVAGDGNPRDTASPRVRPQLPRGQRLVKAERSRRGWREGGAQSQAPTERSLWLRSPRFLRRRAGLGGEITTQVEGMRCPPPVEIQIPSIEELLNSNGRIQIYILNSKERNMAESHDAAASRCVLLSEELTVPVAATVRGARVALHRVAPAPGRRDMHVQLVWSAFKDPHLFLELLHIRFQLLNVPVPFFANLLLSLESRHFRVHLLDVHVLICTNLLLFLEIRHLQVQTFNVPVTWTRRRRRRRLELDVLDHLASHASDLAG